VKPAILVTGGAGYVGSMTCKALDAAGYLPVVYDDLSSGHLESVKWGPIEQGNLADKDALKAVMVRYGNAAVMHFAARILVAESIQSPGLYFQNNVACGLSLLDAMREVGVDTIVFSSSCAVYGMPDTTPITESHSQMPINPYGESKKFFEAILGWYGRAHDIKWAALRYFNAAGADPDGDIGEDHSPETHLIPLAIEAALGSGSPIKIFGTNYPTPDGTAVRDYVHTADLASGHIRALEHLQRGGASDAFNLGTGRGSSVREVIRAVENATGTTGISTAADRRAGDAPILVADASKAASVLGWRPAHSDMPNIIRTAVDWHRSKLATNHPRVALS